MSESLWTRLLCYVCSKLGHSQGKTWEYKGLNAECKICKRWYKIKTEKKDNGNDKE